MKEGPNELLDHLEKVLDEYGDVVEKVPLEEKLIRAHEEESKSLEPWEISDIVQSALGELPEGLNGHVDIIFDIVYEAISEALAEARR